MIARTTSYWLSSPLKPEYGDMLMCLNPSETPTLAYIEATSMESPTPKRSPFICSGVTLSYPLIARNTS